MAAIVEAIAAVCTCHTHLPALYRLFIQSHITAPFYAGIALGTAGGKSEPEGRDVFDVADDCTDRAIVGAMEHYPLSQ